MAGISPAGKAGAPRPGWGHLAASWALSLYFALLASLATWVAIPAFFGYRPVVITSGSMEPAIRTGDVVLLRSLDAAGAHPGSVITYKDPAHPQRLVTHRVHRILDDSHYQTRGDANPVPDVRPVVHDAILGEGRFLVPFIGMPVAWAQTGNYVHLGLFAAWTLFALVGAVRLHRSLRLSPATVSCPTAPRAEASLPGLLSLARWPERDRTATALRRAAVVAAVTAFAVFGITLAQGSQAAFAWSATNEGNVWKASTLAAPTGLEATGYCDSGGNPRVVLTWNGSAGADQYGIFRTTTSPGSGLTLLERFGQTSVATTSNTTYTDTSVAHSTTYYYRVRAQNTDWNWTSGWSNEVMITTPTSLWCSLNTNIAW